MADDRDELLVRKFFEDNAVEVPDDGFTRRVMRRLPDRERRLSRIWAAVCAVAGVLMLLKFNWLGVLVSYIGSLVKALACRPTTSAVMPWRSFRCFSLYFLVGIKCCRRSRHPNQPHLKPEPKAPKTHPNPPEGRGLEWLDKQ